MNKVDTVHLVIRSGAVGTSSAVRMRFNGHVVELTRINGGTGPGETFEGQFHVRSVAHSVSLLGPDLGRWEIEGIVARYEGVEQLTRELGPLALEPGGEADLWNAPGPTFEV